MKSQTALKKRVGSARPAKSANRVKFNHPLEIGAYQDQNSLVRVDLANTSLTPRALEELKKRVKRFMPDQSADSMQKETLF